MDVIKIIYFKNDELNNVKWNRKFKDTCNLYNIQYHVKYPKQDPHRNF